CGSKALFSFFKKLLTLPFYSYFLLWFCGGILSSSLYFATVLRAILILCSFSLSTIIWSLKGRTASSSTITFLIKSLTRVEETPPASDCIALLKKNLKLVTPWSHERNLFEVTLLMVLSCMPMSVATSLRFNGFKN